MNDLENHLLDSPMPDDNPHDGLIHCDICGDPLYTGDLYYVLPGSWTPDGSPKTVCDYCMDVHRYEV